MQADKTSGKLIVLSWAEHRALPSLASLQVYAKLTEARKWEHWLGVAQLVHTAQIEQLQPGNTFCFTSNLAPGFIDAIVQDAEPGKVTDHMHPQTVYMPYRPRSFPRRRCVASWPEAFALR